MLQPLKEAGTDMKTQAEKQACHSGKGAYFHCKLCAFLVTSTFQRETIKAALGGGFFFKPLLLLIASGFPIACGIQLPGLDGLQRLGHPQRKKKNSSSCVAKV